MIDQTPMAILHGCLDIGGLSLPHNLKDIRGLYLRISNLLIIENNKHPTALQKVSGEG